MIWKRSRLWIPIAIAVVGTIFFLGGFALEAAEESSKDREEMELGKCLGCDPPEITEIDASTPAEAILWTDIQSTPPQQWEIAESYFAGLVESYQMGDPASGSATTFNQSVAQSSTLPGWFFKVLLAALYESEQDAGIALRRVDEAASPVKGDEKDCPHPQVADWLGSYISIDRDVQEHIMQRYEHCRMVHHVDWRECHYGQDPQEEPLIKLVQIHVIEMGGYVQYDVCVEVSDVEIPFFLELNASYEMGFLKLNFDIGTPEPAAWANFLILTVPTIQIIPLWTAPLPALDPPVQIPIAFPFQSMGMVGIYSGLFTTDGPKAAEFVWVDTS